MFSHHDEQSLDSVYGPVSWTGKTGSPCISDCYWDVVTFYSVNILNLLLKFNHSELSLKCMSRSYSTPLVAHFTATVA